LFLISPLIIFLLFKSTNRLISALAETPVLGLTILEVVAFAFAETVLVIIKSSSSRPNIFVSFSILPKLVTSRDSFTENPADLIRLSPFIEFINWSPLCPASGKGPRATKLLNPFATELPTAFIF